MIDQGPNPLVIDICRVAQNNIAFRAAIWTGTHLQTTLMSIPPGGEIGLETHPHTDQFIRIESGQGLVSMGPNKDMPTIRQSVCKNSAIFVPAGIWHNLVNTGNCPIKLYSIYAPPQHPRGTFQMTKAEAEEEEKQKSYIINNRATGLD